MRGQPRDVLAVEEDAPAAGAQHAGQAVEERGFAGPVRTDDGADLAGLDGDADVVEGGESAEADGQAVGLEQWRAAPVRGGRSGETPGAVGGPALGDVHAGGDNLLSLGGTPPVAGLAPLLSHVKLPLD